MAHLDPLPRDAVANLQSVFNGAEAAMGFVPNSMLTMAYMPQLTMAFSMLAGVTFGADLKTLMQSYKETVPQGKKAKCVS